jgi:hypothetical protein
MRPINPEYSYTNITASTTAAVKTIIAAASGMRHRIVGLTVAAAAAQVLTLQSSTGGAMLGPLNLAAGIPFVWAPNPMGYLETAASRGVYNQSGNATETIINVMYQTYKAT